MLYLNSAEENYSVKHTVLLQVTLKKVVVRYPLGKFLDNIVKREALGCYLIAIDKIHIPELLIDMKNERGGLAELQYFTSIGEARQWLHAMDEYPGNS